MEVWWVRVKLLSGGPQNVRGLEFDSEQFAIARKKSPCADFSSVSLTREPLFLKLHGERYSAAKIGHIVIENALVRLACCQRADGAHRQKFIHAIIRG
jgi:hypothetical protein